MNLKSRLDSLEKAVRGGVSFVPAGGIPVIYHEDFFQLFWMEFNPDQTIPWAGRYTKWRGAPIPFDLLIKYEGERPIDELWCGLFDVMKSQGERYVAISI